MSLSSHAFNSILDALIDTLQIYRTTGALSDYGHAKLGTVADLRTIRGSLLKVIQDDDPQRVWAKLQALYRKIFAVEFLAAPAGQKMVRTLHQCLFAEGPIVTPEQAEQAEQSEQAGQAEQSQRSGQSGLSQESELARLSQQSDLSGQSPNSGLSQQSEPSQQSLQPAAPPATPAADPTPAPQSTPDPSLATPAPLPAVTAPTPQVAQPEIAQPQVAQPQVAQPEIAQPQVAQPQVAQPEIAQPQIAQPQVAQPEIAQPQIAQPQIAQPQIAQPQVAQPEIAQPQIAQPQVAAAIAMVLLDADHFSLDREREVYIQQKTNCQILYRVAFANWKNRGNDSDLHHRHYLLIHVPAGRDRTDGAMLTFGSSIRSHYPRVHQVFIGSNDQIFSSLATTLVQQGYEVYRITQQGDRVAVRDVVSGDEWEIPQPAVPLDVLYERLVKLCQWLHRKSPWISLDQLAQAYERRHGCTFDRDLGDRLNDLLPHQANTQPASLLTFLQASPQQFVLYQSPEQPEITWISLFSPSLITQAAASEDASTDSQTTFEQQLIPLIDTVLQKAPNKYPDGLVSLSEVTHEFRNTYQQGINTVCTELTGKRVGVFLQTATLTLLQAKKQGNKGWFLGKA